MCDLTVSALRNSSSAISALEGSAAKPAPASGRQSEISTRRWAPEIGGGAAVAGSVSAIAWSRWARNTSWVSPTRTTSPSRSSWRPCMRWPLTNEPLREEPSSTSVHSSPMRSSTACTRDTDGSSGSAMSQAGWRPMVARAVAGSSSRMHCSSGCGR